MAPPAEISDDPQALVEWYTQYAVPLRPQPGLLVLSIIVSVLGSYATLLCLGQRTGSRGWRNYVLLGCASLCFAAVGIWGMHFVSMISTRLRPSPEYIWYLEFSQGMTALSLFVPLIAVSVAFWFLGDEAEYSWWRIPFAGVFVGLTIELMHYCAGFHMPYLIPSYTAVTVVFAAILACAAATVAFYAFFKFRSQWQDSWWRRGICALALATAVCGMHYLGLGGTSYRVKEGVNPSALSDAGDQATRLTIVISVMCGVIVLLALAFFAYTSLRRSKSKKAGRQIVIASAAFDEFGRILVKPDGTLPMQVIETDAAIERVLAQVDPRQETFQWLYLLSFNWGLLRPFVRRMFQRMRARSADPVYNDPLNFSLNLDQSFDHMLFRTRFMEAAVSLAQQLDIAVESLGLLFDRVLSTGTKGHTPAESKERYEEKLDDWTSDYGRSVHGITLTMDGKQGVVMFLVRKIDSAKPFYHLMNDTEQARAVSNDNVESYNTRGYRMAEARFFARAFADRVGVTTAEMEVFLSACKTFSRRGAKVNVQKGGVYVSVFGLRPGGRGREDDLEVLVYNFAHHLIPSFRLPELDQLMSPTMMKWIKTQGGKTLAEVLRNVNQWIHLADDAMTPEQQVDPMFVDFMAALSVSIEGMITSLRVWPNLQNDARLSTDIVHLPGPTDRDLPIQTILFGVVLTPPDVNIMPSYAAQSQGTIMPEIELRDIARHDRPPHPFIYTPFSLFAKAHSQIHRGPRWRAHARLTTGELNRLYPPLPQDAAKQAESETDDSVGQSSLGSGLWHKSKASGDGMENLADDPESPHSMFSRNKSSKPTDLEQGIVRISDSVSMLKIPEDKQSKRPTTADRVKAAMEGIRGKPAKTADEDEEQRLKGNYSHEYAWVRDVHDGWYIRHTEWLEETDQTGAMEGNAWRLQALGPGGM